MFLNERDQGGQYAQRCRHQHDRADRVGQQRRPGKYYGAVIAVPAQADSDQDLVENATPSMIAM